MIKPAHLDHTQRIIHTLIIDGSIKLSNYKEDASFDSEGNIFKHVDMELSSGSNSDSISKRSVNFKAINTIDFYNVLSSICDVTTTCVHQIYYYDSASIPAVFTQKLTQKPIFYYLDSVSYTDQVVKLDLAPPIMGHKSFHLKYSKELCPSI